VNAYDYIKQCWVSGADAATLLREQAEDTLAVIDSPGYRRLMGYSDEHARTIKQEAQRLIASLEEAK
jgi:hypothetical protein